MNPRAVIARIQPVVGGGFRIGNLQDLQSPAHRAFEIRSDGLIALSGVDENMRKNTRTATELTAPLLMENGDCRETMNLNGAIFACWQQIRVESSSPRRCSASSSTSRGFDSIVQKEIPALSATSSAAGKCSCTSIPSPCVKSINVHG